MWKKFAIGTYLVIGLLGSTALAGSVADGLIKLFDDNKSNSITIDTPSNITSNRTITLEDDATPIPRTAVSGVPDADYGDLVVSSGVWDIDADSITSAEIAADAVGASEIAANAVTGSEIAADAIGSSELDAAAVESELEAVLDLADLQGSLTLSGDVTGAHGTNDLNEAAVEGELESVLDLADLQGTITGAKITDSSISYADLNSADSPADEECLTYEASSGFFEWQTCGSGGAGITDGDKGDITVSSSGAVWDLDADVVGSAEIATDAVSADELDATGVEAELEAVLDLADLQGSITESKLSITDLTIGDDLTVTGTIGPNEDIFFSQSTDEHNKIYAQEATGRLTFGMTGDTAPTRLGSYFSVFGNNWASATQRGGAEFIVDNRNSGTGGFKLYEYDGASFVGRLWLDVTSDDLILSSATDLVWTDGTANGGTADTRFCRDAAGTISVKTTDCSTRGVLETGTIELGADSDTTIARSGAGAATLEGSQLITAGNAAAQLESTLEGVMDLPDLQGILTVAKGGNGAAPAADDQVNVSSSTSAATWTSIPDCDAADQTLNYDTATNAFSCGSDAGAGGGMTSLADDTTPQLGGDLDLNTFDITGTGDINITGSVTASVTVQGADVTSTDDVTVGDDLLIASGGVVNFNAGDVTVTHASNDLEVAGGSLHISTDGSTISPHAPAVFGMSDLSAGEAASWQFGDAFNAIQSGYGQKMDMYSYHGIRLFGGTADATNALPYEGGNGASDDSVTILGGELAVDDEGTLKFYEEDAGGTNFKGFKAPAAVTADTTCTFENDANFIPDSCVGDGSDADTNTLGPDGDKGDITVGGTGTTLELDASVVGNAEMADNAIGNAEMADNAVGNSEMADDAVGSNELDFTDETTPSDGQCVMIETGGTAGSLTTGSCGAGGLSDGDYGDIIVGGSGTTMDLDEAGVETELEGVLDLADMQGDLTGTRNISVAGTIASTGANSITAGDDLVSTDDVTVGDDLTVTDAATANTLTLDGGGADVNTLTVIPSGLANQTALQLDVPPASARKGFNIRQIGDSTGFAAFEWPQSDLARFCLGPGGSSGRDTCMGRKAANTFEINTGTSGTLAALIVGTIELGAQSDTTLSRPGAGRLAVEGVDVILDGTDTVDATNIAANSVANSEMADDAIGTAEMADADHGDISWSGGVASVDANAVALATDTSGNYVADLTAGTAIDVSGGGSENATVTVDVDLTELNTVTFGSGTFTTLTFDAGATDPVLTFGSGTLLNEAVTSFRQADAADAGGQIKLLEDPGTGSNFISLLAPASITSDVTCTLENDSSPIPDSCVGDGTDAGGSAAGSDTQVQFNDGGSAFGGDAGLTYNKTTDDLTLGGKLNLSGLLQFSGTSSSFPALKRSGTNLHVRLADDSNFSSLIADGLSMVTGPLSMGGSSDAQVGRGGAGIVTIGGSTAASGTLRILEDGDNGSNYIGFAVPSAITANVTCTLEDDSSPIPDSCVGDGTDGGGGITDVVQDTTPQLGGALDTNGQNIELGTANTDTTLVRSAAGEATLEGDAIKHAGKQMMWIPAGAMKASSLSPASCGDTYDSGSNDVTLVVCAFDTGATEENAEFGFNMPKNWNESTITMEFVWTNAAGLTTETVQWKIACTGFGNDDALNTAYPADVTVSDTWLAQNDLHVTAETSAITVQNAAENDFVQCRVGRDTSVDNMTGDALLIGAKVYWTDNASTLAE